MRFATNLNPIFSSNILSINRTLQNGTPGGKDANNLTSPFRVDRVSISPQGKAANIIDTLTKQKMMIEDRKNSLISSSLENGQSMDSIRAQLDSYDEQLEDIDKQIAKISAKQMEEANEKKKGSAMDSTPETENEKKNEIENQRMQNLMETSIDLDRIDTIDSVKTKIDGDSAVLESEIELDKMRSNGAPSSPDALSKKEEQLADMQKHSLELTSEIGMRMADLAEDIQENNDTLNAPDHLSIQKPRERTIAIETLESAKNNINCILEKANSSNLSYGERLEFIRKEHGNWVDDIRKHDPEMFIEWLKLNRSHIEDGRPDLAGLPTDFSMEDFHSYVI